MATFWRDVRRAARSLNVKEHLPSDWRDMSGSGGVDDLGTDLRLLRI